MNLQEEYATTAINHILLVTEMKNPHLNINSFNNQQD
jgi:hypothetical protein